MNGYKSARLVIVRLRAHFKHQSRQRFGRQGQPAFAVFNKQHGGLLPIKAFFEWVSAVGEVPVFDDVCRDFQRQFAFVVVDEMAEQDKLLRGIFSATGEGKHGVVITVGCGAVFVVQLKAFTIECRALTVKVNRRW